MKKFREKCDLFNNCEYGKGTSCPYIANPNTEMLGVDPKIVGARPALPASYSQT